MVEGILAVVVSLLLGGIVARVEAVNKKVDLMKETYATKQEVKEKIEDKLDVVKIILDELKEDIKDLKLKRKR